jgi:lysophospholipase L1-like esterase
MSKTRFWLSLCLGAVAVAAAGSASAKTKVACVGASTTKGSGSTEGHHFPDELGRLLGPDHEVHNFGVSSAGALKKAQVSYWNTKEFQAATALLPDLVVLWLGGADTKPENWEANQASFKSDYLALIRHFQGLSSRPRVFCMLSVAIKDASGVRKAILEGKVNPLQKEAAAEANCPLVDLQTAVGGRAEYFPDGIHPNNAGTLAIAKAAHTVIVANAADAGVGTTDAGVADAGESKPDASSNDAGAGSGGAGGAAGASGSTGSGGSGGAGLGGSGGGSGSGVAASGGSPGSGGRAGGGAGGSSGKGEGTGGAPTGGASESGGCVFAGSSQSVGAGLLFLVLGAALASLRRRTRARV